MTHPRPQLLVVGVGASAGGLEALQAFFAHAPPASGCAYVVLLHRSPDHDSQLAALLQTVTALPVDTVTTPVRVEPDHVYVVSPNQHLTMVDGALQVAPYDAEEVGLVGQLKAEVARLRHQLRLAIEQYEVQIEELRTVNQELKLKVEEATQTSANLQNLVNSTNIGTVFLDRELRVRLFTPAARNLFNLVAADYGRPLADLTHRLLDVDVLGEAEQVLARQTAVEREVRTRDGRVYVLRVLPYGAGEERIDGVVLICFDITERRRNEQLQAYLLRLGDALRASTEAEAIQEAVMRLALEQIGADRCYYCEIEGGTAIIRRDGRRDGLPSVAGAYPLQSMPIFGAIVEAARPFVVHDAATADILDENLRQLCLQLGIVSFIDVPVVKQGVTVGLLCITKATPRHWSDLDVELAVVTAERTWEAVRRARAEEALRTSEARFRTVTDAVPQVIWTNDVAGNTVYFNQRWYAYSGLSYEQSLGHGWQAIVHSDDAADALERWQRAFAAGTMFEHECRLRRADGVYRWHLARNVPLHDEHGQLIGWFGSATDIEELKLAEAARRESAILRRLADAQEEERLRIARDLHDQLGQQVTSLQLGLKQLEGEVASGAAHERLASLQALAVELAKESHRLAVSLRPTALEDVGLIPALERLLEEWSRLAGIAAAFEHLGLGPERLPRLVEVALFRVVQEALTNVQKHAAATQVGVIVERRGDQLVVVVEDNGRGGVENTAGSPGERQSLGILGMRERVEQLGGTLEIETAPGAGTTVLARISLGPGVGQAS